MQQSLRLFADDTAIYLAVSSLEDAQIEQQDLDHLRKLELEWDMEFNPSKCVVIHITRSRTPVPSQYLLHGQVLESTACSKYLGVEISSNLSFNSHIQNITTSASRSIGFLKRKNRSQNPALRKMAYKTLVRHPPPPPWWGTHQQYGVPTPIKSSFDQFVMDLRPQCYIQGFKAVGVLVPEKRVFGMFLPYMGVAAVLVM